MVVRLGRRSAQQPVRKLAVLGALGCFICFGLLLQVANSGVHSVLGHVHPVGTPAVSEFGAAVQIQSARGLWV